MANNDCLFCKIINNEIPAFKVYEDAQVIAFLDIHPVNTGHTLIVPKKHSANLLDADEATLQAMIVVTKKVSQAVIDALGLQSFNLELNNGEIAGQVIPHLHWHIVPRKADDGFKHWPGSEYKPGEAEEILTKIKAQI